jgi:hypothetical protein
MDDIVFNSNNQLDSRNAKATGENFLDNEDNLAKALDHTDTDGKSYWRTRMCKTGTAMLESVFYFYIFRVF